MRGKRKRRVEPAEGWFIGYAVIPAPPSFIPTWQWLGFKEPPDPYLYEYKENGFLTLPHTNHSITLKIECMNCGKTKTKFGPVFSDQKQRGKYTSDKPILLCLDCYDNYE